MGWRSVRVRIGWVLLALCVLGNAGCLVVAGATGVAVGGALVAGYVWSNGALYREYPSSLVDAVAAVRVSLVELNFPLIDERPGTGEVTVSTRTSDGTLVRIRLEFLASPIPVEGPLTRISVRVGLSGDDLVSARILDQVSRHLVAVSAVAPPPPLGTVAVPAPPGPRETSAPPLAPTVRVVPAGGAAR